MFGSHGGGGGANQLAFYQTEPGHRRQSSGGPRGSGTRAGTEESPPRKGSTETDGGSKSRRDTPSKD
jgi:hypothetical protein